MVNTTSIGLATRGRFPIGDPADYQSALPPLAARTVARCIRRFGGQLATAPVEWPKEGARPSRPQQRGQTNALRTAPPPRPCRVPPVWTRFPAVNTPEKAINHEKRERHELAQALFASFASFVVKLPWLALPPTCWPGGRHAVTGRHGVTRTKEKRPDTTPAVLRTSAKFFVTGSQPATRTEYTIPGFPHVTRTGDKAGFL